MMNVTWLDTEKACNNIFKKYHNTKVDDYVKSCCMRALPHAMTQMMATALYEGLTQQDEDVAVICDAYRQLKEKGYIGGQEES